MKGFWEFIKAKGVFGLAIGIMMGGAVTKLVTSLVNDIINPILGPILGATGKLSEAVIRFGSISIRWGSFLNSVIDFIIISLVVYLGIKILRLDVIEKKKVEKPKK